MKLTALFAVLAAGTLAGGRVAAQAPPPAAKPAAPQTGARFTFGGQTLTVPDGFVVELAAGPPLVDRPISADFDELGRLYVTDSSGTNDKVDKQLAEKPHRVVRLEDSDGDGRFDKSTVFADKMMFPEGAMWFDGSLYVAAPPSIWKLTDADGDGVAERREEWFQGKTLTGCANDLHGPYLGLDGWIYWCKGAFAKQTYERPGKKPFVTRAAHVFRARPDGTGIEAVMTGGMDNPVELVFTPEGERIITSTFLQNPEVGKRDGLIHAIYGGVYGKANDVVDDHPRTGSLMPILDHLGPAVPAAVARCASRALGDDYEGCLLTACFNLHKITRQVLEPDGATFRTRDSDFLSSDATDFHPTDVLEDADGSVLILDTGGWYKLCCPTSQLPKPAVLGAIYRVRRNGAPRAEDPRGRKIDWASRGPESLSTLLADPRPAVRERASREIAKRGPAAIPDLAAVLRGGASPGVRREALWALTRIDGSAAREAARAGLADRAETVQHAAAHAAGVWRDAGSLPGLLSLLKESSPHVRRSAAEALGRLGRPEAVPALLEALEKSPDRVLEHSLIYAVIEIGDPQSTAGALASASPAARRAALMALDQMEGGGLRADVVIPLLSSSDRQVQETASWVAGRHPEWSGALTGYLRDRLRGSAAGGKAGIEEELSRFAKGTEVQQLMGETAGDAASPLEVRRTAFSAMARTGLKQSPSSWIKAIAGVLAAPDRALAKAAVAAARSSPPSKEDAPTLSSALLALAADGSAPTDLRLDALAAVPGGLPPLGADLFKFLRAHLSPEAPAALRGAAVAALARAKLSREQLLELTEALKEVGPIEIVKLLPAFQAGGDEDVGIRFLSALQESSGAAGLRSESVKEVLTKFPETVRRRGEELLQSLDAEAASQKTRLEEILSAVQHGDVQRGQALFNTTKAACATCHAIGYLGGRVGPDLTRIGEIRNERDLLESIVFPSASFVRSYEPFVVVTRGGEVHNGVLRKDAPDEVILAKDATTEARIQRENIADLRPGSVSIMPQGLDQQLTRQELADLLAFLKSTRWGP